MIDGYDLDRIAKLIAAHDALDPRDRVMLENYLTMFPLSEDAPTLAVSEKALKEIRSKVEKLLANTSVRIVLAGEALPLQEDGGEAGSEEQPDMGAAFMDRKKVRKKKGVPL